VGDDVYEAVKSPVSTRFSGATAAVSDDGDEDDVGSGAVSEDYTYLLGSLLGRLLAPTCHNMFTDVAFSMPSTVCVE
jgi:hypothetical protein